VDPHGLAAGERRRTCVPLMEYDGEACPAIEDFHPWEALEVVSYALDDTLPASLSALACQSELTYEDSCCYFVEFWDTVNGSAADACVPANPQGGGGGGGGGWGWDDGRPFTVQGVKVKAPAVQGSGWSRGAWDAPANLSPVLRARAAAAWLKTAQAEHSSVASFSRFNLQLLEMGAPAELLLRSTGAIVDEIRHARDAFGVASTLANTEYTAGPLQMDSTASSMSLKEALMDAILEGCINETVSAAFVREAARKTTDRDLAAMLERVADDEARHSELSWAFARWVLRQHPEFRQDVSDLFDTFELGPAPQEDPDRQALAELGVLTEDYQHEVATDILAHVVVPCARALLQSV